MPRDAQACRSYVSSAWCVVWLLGGVKVNVSREAAKPKVISATMLRTKTRDILEEAKFSGGHFIVETFGKPMVAIVGIEEYWELRNRALDREREAVRK
jgi:hypothetical protein